MGIRDRLRVKLRVLPGAAFDPTTVDGVAAGLAPAVNANVLLIFYPWKGIYLNHLHGITLEFDDERPLD